MAVRPLRKSTVIDFVSKSLYVSADLDTSTVVERLRKTIRNIVIYCIIIIAFCHIHSYFALILLKILSHIYQVGCYFIKHIHRSMNRLRCCDGK